MKIPDETYKISHVMHFSAGTRLMCPMCGTTSSNHKPHSPREEYLFDQFSSLRVVCLHTCHVCGYTDDSFPEFIDSGNDDREAFVMLAEWEDELIRLKEEVVDLERKIKSSKALYQEVWCSEEDTTK